MRFCFSFDKKLKGVVLKNTGLFRSSKEASLSTLATDASSKLDVLWHDSDSLGVNCAQVAVLEQANQVGFRSLLQSHHSACLKAEISLEVLSNFSHKTLER
jgi:hypothetical protein